jgi:hypothetical protein
MLQRCSPYATHSSAEANTLSMHDIPLECLGMLTASICFKHCIQFAT